VVSPHGGISCKVLILFGLGLDFVGKVFILECLSVKSCFKRVRLSVAAEPLVYFSTISSVTNWVELIGLHPLRFLLGGK
jgi:hypothetical protein